MVSYIVNCGHNPACAPREILPGLNPRPLFPHLFVFPSLFGPQTPANSNYSRTSRKFARKSNYSRTYAKTGGGGIFLFHLPLSLPLLPFPAHLPLSPTIPALTGTSPVSPIVPALTQTPGGGGHTTPFLLRHGQLLPYESYQLQYVPLHYVSMSARRQFCCAEQKDAQALRGSPRSSGQAGWVREKSRSLALLGMTNYGTRVTQRESRVTKHKSRSTSHGSRSTSHETFYRARAMTSVRSSDCSPELNSWTAFWMLATRRAGGKEKHARTVPISRASPNSFPAASLASVTPSV